MKTLSAKDLKNAKAFRRLDFIIYVFVFITVLALFFGFVVFADDGELKKIEISIDKNVVATYDFTTDNLNVFSDIVKKSDDGQTLKLFIDDDGNENVIVIEKVKKYVYIESANCRSQDCVHSKKITKSGESVICVPHKLIVKGTGNGINDPILG